MLEFLNLQDYPRLSASKYMLYLPSEEELKIELTREQRAFAVSQLQLLEASVIEASSTVIAKKKATSIGKVKKRK